MARYEMGDPALDRTVAELVERTGGGGDPDLIAEMITTALKLHRDGTDRGRLKLFNSALKEMRHTARVFGACAAAPKVTVFGSARTPPGHPDYRLARGFARYMWERRGWMAVTGAGPGIMEAANRGAGREGSFGVNIRLPFEAAANPYISAGRLINYKYFFTRKLGFVMESRAFAVFPGGVGTMDEAFELLTLIQTGKAPLQPIVLMEEEPSYWPAWQRFVTEQLLEKGMIHPSDTGLYRIVNRIEDAADEICGFYANYRSQRYVEGCLVIRLRRPPTDRQIEMLNDEFSDILSEGRIERAEPHPVEIRDGDGLDCARVRLSFDRRSAGRLRAMFDALNGFAPPPPSPAAGAAAASAG